MKLGKAIKIARVKRGWKQSALAEQLDVSANYISMLENDRRDPSWSFVCRLADVLGVPLSLLILMASDGEETAVPSTRSKIAKELIGLVASIQQEVEDGDE